MVGLLPGTLASHHENQTLHVHALDQHQDWEKTVTELELRLSQLLGEKNV
jgi:multicomponent Na+:H+ antiporter subunit E